ncbi:MAG: calcium-binding protein [Pseudomonadota bacterium]
MVDFVINRPTFQPTSSIARGTGGNDILGRALTPIETSALAFLVGLGNDRNDVLDAIFLGQVEGLPPPDDTPFEGNQRYFGRGGDDYVVDLLGSNSVNTETRDDRLLLGSGNDRVFDSGGNNRITIEGGNNILTLGAGNDTVQTGTGRDNVFIRGGDNSVVDLGGDNSITTRDGDDTITTGAGNDNINAFDGRNVIDAGDGRNIVRGGDGFDEVNVGVGSDFVDVRGGDDSDTEIVDLPFLGVVFEASNVVNDRGGSDNIRATSGSSSNGDDLVLSDFGGVFGDDVIDLRGGDNLVVDLGGNDRVTTLDGDDIVFTSFVAAGDDIIDTGEGDDLVNPGLGNDRVRAGPGRDQIVLENDGDADTVAYELEDVTFATADTDLVVGFDGSDGAGNAIDMFDVSTLDVDASMLSLAPVGPGFGDPAIQDLLVQWDTDGNGAPNFFTSVLVDFDFSTPLTSLADDSFVFDSLVV